MAKSHCNLVFTHSNTARRWNDVTLTIATVLRPRDATQRHYANQGNLVSNGVTRSIVVDQLTGGVGRSEGGLVPTVLKSKTILGIQLLLCCIQWQI